MNDAQQRFHIFPLDITTNGRASSSHETDNTGMCGCKPVQMQDCHEADLKGRCFAGCWRCAGVGMIAPWNEDRTLLIIHREYPTGALCYNGEPAKTRKAFRP